MIGREVVFRVVRYSDTLGTSAGARSPSADTSALRFALMGRSFPRPYVFKKLSAEADAFARLITAEHVKGVGALAGKGCVVIILAGRGCPI